MSILLAIAGREIREGMRNRWVLAATGLLAALALALAFLGSAPTGEVGIGRLAVTVVSLASLAIYLLPLIALLLVYDSVAGEAESGTLLLLLAYPLARWQVIVGKFMGHAAILTFATVVGFGVAGAAIAAAEPPSLQEWLDFMLMIGASVGLGWAFVAIGLLISVSVHERATAAGLAMAVWLILVVLYDLALMGGLVATAGQGPLGDALPALLLLNPADAYRLVTLMGSESAARLTGLQAVSATMPAAGPLLALAAWVVVPLGLATARFVRRDI